MRNKCSNCGAWRPDAFELCANCEDELDKARCDAEKEITFRALKLVQHCESSWRNPNLVVRDRLRKEFEEAVKRHPDYERTKI